MNYLRRAKFALAMAPILSLLVISFSTPVHAAELYSLSALPAYSQEGSTIALDLTVSQALPSTTYEFTFTVTDPANTAVNTGAIAHTTGTTETSFMILVSYPGPSFGGAGGSTSLVGTYQVRVDQGKPTGVANVASTTFMIGIIDKTVYQRTQTVSIVATRYSAGTLASVVIKTSVTAVVVYSHSTSVPLNGQVIDSWQIPKNATTTESYTATVTGTPIKAPPDTGTFSVQPAPVTISSLSSGKSVYQRTETLTFTFQPLYPNGQIATTGQATIRLTSPTNYNVSLTATYNASAQLFAAIYKTSTTNTTGTWNASLATSGFNDGFGNIGPGGPLAASTQLQKAALSTNIVIKNYFLANEPIKFNATITYPDGSSFQSGNVTSTLVYSGGGYNAKVPTVYDNALKLWVGTYIPKGNEPGGLWSLTVSGLDTATPANSGGATRAIQLQDRPPIAMVSGSTNAVLTGVSIVFNSTGSYDPDGTVASYSWNYGDGSSGSGPSTSHSFSTAGTYTVTLTVTDNSGSTASARLAVVIQDRPPVARLSASSTNTVTGSTLSFDGGASSDPDGSIVTYRWDFGDGTSGTGITTGHSYTNPGNYTVRLTIIDNSGQTASASSTVSIRPAPLTSSSTFIFVIIIAVLAGVVGSLLFFIKRHKVTRANLKIDLEAVKSEAGKIESSDFFKSIKGQLDKDNETK